MFTGGFSPGEGVNGRGVKLAIDLRLVLRSRKLELYLHFPICLHGVVLN
jgi:hypothetical protein